MKPTFAGWMAVTVLLGMWAGGPSLPARAEGISQEQANAILEELQGIRKLLEAQQALLERRTAQGQGGERIVKIPAVDTFVLGSHEAPVTLVEFTDYQCPFCNRFHTETYPQLKRDFIDTGKVRFISRDLPLGIHKQAFPAARAARCAGEQGKFWDMRHVLSSNPKNLSEAEIGQYAEELGLDQGRFRACVGSTKFDDAIRRDEADARAAGISGTPAFLLGHTQPGDQFEAVHISGAQHFSVFASKINKLLAAAKPSDGIGAR